MGKIDFLVKYKIHHFLFWLVIAGIWYYLRVDDYAAKTTALKITVIKVADLAALIYLTNYLFIPFFLYRKRYLLFASAFILLIVLSSILKMNVIGRMINNPALYNWSSNWKARVYDNILPHFFLVTAGVAIKLFFDYVQLQRRMAAIAREKAEAELNFLKSQINPHFIFNSLNAVHFLIDKENTAARAALQKFSDMLRYQLYEMQDKKIPIEKEISFLKDYIDLQKLRVNEQYDIQFTMEESAKDLLIEPLLLIPLVENAFKHVSHHTGKKNFIHVNIKRQNGNFFFSVNNSRDVLPSPANNDGGIGLQNVKKRLELLYPGRHHLEITENEENFFVNLKIQLA